MRFKHDDERFDKFDYESTYFMTVEVSIDRDCVHITKMGAIPELMSIIWDEEAQIGSCPIEEALSNGKFLSRLKDGPYLLEIEFEDFPDYDWGSEEGDFYIFPVVKSARQIGKKKNSGSRDQ